MFGSETKTGYGYILFYDCDKGSHSFEVGYIEEIGSYTILHDVETSTSYKTEDVKMIVWTPNEPL
jgi:hypothetical protein